MQELLAHTRQSGSMAADSCFPAQQTQVPRLSRAHRHSGWKKKEVKKVLQINQSIPQLE